jgi:hypothetical protein
MKTFLPRYQTRSKKTRSRLQLDFMHLQVCTTYVCRADSVFSAGKLGTGHLSTCLHRKSSHDGRYLIGFLPLSLWNSYDWLESEICLTKRELHCLHPSGREALWKKQSPTAPKASKGNPRKGQTLQKH